MADNSLDNLAMGSSLAGDPLSLSAGNGLTSSSSSSSGGFDMGSAGALGAGALGLGAMLFKGEAPLPSQFGDLTSSVPNLRGQAGQLETQGHTLVGQGTDALAMAQRGELTAPQKAQLGQYETGLTNQARQQWASMGRNPDQDTSFISQTADIDAKVNAMAQQEIQTTIQLGLGEISGGNSLASTGLGFENAANQALITAGQAQLQQDKNYSDSLTAAFTSIGKMFGAMAL
jgi:hypothetical protein